MNLNLTWFKVLGFKLGNSENNDSAIDFAIEIQMIDDLAADDKSVFKIKSTHIIDGCYYSFYPQITIVRDGTEAPNVILNASIINDTTATYGTK